MVGFVVFWGVLAGLSGLGWFLTRVITPQWVSVSVPEDWPDAVRYAVLTLGDPAASATVFHHCGLGSPEAGYPVVHTITRTRVGVLFELVTVAGQSVKAFRDKADDLAATVVVPKVRVLDLGSGNVGVEAVVFDPLATPRPAMVSTGPVNLQAVVTGVGEDGGWWLVQVLYRHLLIAGASGAGKSGVLWAILVGLAPAIRDGVVEVWAVDPLRVELAPGKPLFTRYVRGTDETVTSLLTELAAVMDERLDRMEQAGIRKHVPTVDEPAIVVPIDEVLVVTAFAPQREIGVENDRLIRLLAAAGRKAAVSLILLGQDPSKEIMAFRQMMTARIALRMTEPGQTRMVLGDSAREEGVRCEDIPENSPGVGWVGVDGERGFARVRAFEVTDDDIAAIVTLYAPQPRPVDLSAFDTRDSNADGNVDGAA